MQDLNRYAHLLSPSGIAAIESMPNEDTKSIESAVSSVSGAGNPSARRAMEHAHKEAAKPHATPEQTESIMRVLLSKKVPVDIQVLSNLTKVSTRKLSWRLLCLVQHGQISRRKEHQAKVGERFNYFLSDTQRDAAIKIWGYEEEATPTQASISILKALYHSPEDLEVADLARLAGLSVRETSWRLTRMIRHDTIARRRAPKITKAFRYFLRPDQRADAEKWCSDPADAHNPNQDSNPIDPDGQSDIKIQTVTAAGSLDPAEAFGIITNQQNLQITQKQRAKLEQQLAEIENKIKQDKDVINSLQRQLVEQQAKAHEIASEKERVMSVHAKTLAKAQMSPLALSERLRFIQRLRTRPALESMAALREIELDYMHALTIARGK